MNYYPFNVGDYAAHTAHLEPMEDLAYRRLLDQYYLREGPLPVDIQATAKLIRLRSMAADVESVLKEFFTLTDDGWRHSRCDAEIEKMQDKQAKARASGIASANARCKAQQEAVERAFASAQSDAQRSLVSESTDVQLPTPTPTPTPIPKEKTKTARKRAAPSVLVSVDEMVDQGVDRQHAIDWMANRKAKGLPLTPTAWSDTQSEAAKAGITLPQAIKIAAGNAWGGFKASWLHRDGRINGSAGGSADPFDGAH